VLVAVSLEYQDEVLLEPGANTSKFESDERASVELVEPTVIAAAARDGEPLQAFALSLPAATAYVTPLPVDRLTALSNVVSTGFQPSTYQAPAGGTPCGMDDDRYIGCDIRLLPQDQWVDAAVAAAAENPVNAPATAILALALPEAVIDREHLALVTQKFWRSRGVHLTVGWLDDPPADLRRRILSHMNAWGTFADVRFSESAVDPQVRISRGDGGYWSNLGTDILSVPADEPTMNLEGFTMDTPESEFVRVVRHETGHTLGFPHEHRRAEIVSNIDRAKALAFFEETQGWDAATTTQQVLTPLDRSALVATATADPHSIMCYALPGAIMRDGRPVPGGTDIDRTDGAFAAGVYPKH
jgi:hypothetical protein